MPFEDAGNIGVWAHERGHTVTRTRLDLGEPLPPQAAFDWLVVMGGPMSVYQHDVYPWLALEKEFLRESIDRGAWLLGVCLGAQLAADVLGGRVTRNSQPEIGWLPVWLTEEAGTSPLFAGFPQRFLPFHWHGDTFSLPAGATPIARSEACVNQVFQWNRVIGLQFHLEYPAAAIESMLCECGDELTDGPSVQRPDQMLPFPERIEEARRLLYGLLDSMARMDGTGVSPGV